ncbi:hypothetical protein [Xylella fastidiosa]|uniref:hypothetical protein n=1 Tax=Xylella fastidiosa TaxID=2371 RepID=UPI0013E374D9|nr:hypothetical protein [Xylella fastidiosa]
MQKNNPENQKLAEQELIKPNKHTPTSTKNTKEKINKKRSKRKIKKRPNQSIF